jgi:hypothetical protein
MDEMGAADQPFGNVRGEVVDVRIVFALYAAG